MSQRGGTRQKKISVAHMLGDWHGKIDGCHCPSCRDASECDSTKKFGSVRKSHRTGPKRRALQLGEECDVNVVLESAGDAQLCEPNAELADSLSGPKNVISPGYSVLNVVENDSIIDTSAVKVLTTTEDKSVNAKIEKFSSTAIVKRKKANAGNRSSSLFDIEMETQIPGMKVDMSDSFRGLGINVYGFQFSRIDPDEHQSLTVVPRDRNLTKAEKREQYKQKNTESINIINFIECEICYKKLKETSYRQHYNTHRRDAPRFWCHLCDASFTRRADVDRHCRARHETNVDCDVEIVGGNHTSGSSSLVCEKCGARFLKHQYFDNHVKYVCSVGDELHMNDDEVANTSNVLLEKSDQKFNVPTTQIFSETIPKMLESDLNCDKNSLNPTSSDITVHHGTVSLVHSICNENPAIEEESWVEEAISSAVSESTAALQQIKTMTEAGEMDTDSMEDTDSDDGEIEGCRDMGFWSGKYYDDGSEDEEDVRKEIDTGGSGNELSQVVKVTALVDGVSRQFIVQMPTAAGVDVLSENGLETIMKMVNDACQGHLDGTVQIDLLGNDE